MKAIDDGADAINGRGCPVTGPQPGDNGLRGPGEVHERPAALSDVLRQAGRGLLRDAGAAVQKRPVDELADEAAVQGDAPRHCEQLAVAVGYVDAVRGPAGVGNRVAELFAECPSQGGLAGAVAAVQDDDRVGSERCRQPAGHGRFPAIASSAGQL